MNSGDRAALRAELTSLGFERFEKYDKTVDGSYTEIWGTDTDKVTIEWGPRTP